ncbi:MAG TPA: glucoamylase family protein [Fervidobacterium sp.]|nr:glucoamylase family protein [Fervidobacterium sp.]
MCRKLFNNTIFVLLITLLLIPTFTIGATSTSSTNDSTTNKKEPEILELESRKSFDFFWQEANTNKDSKGYGLIRDRAPGNPQISSIASVGFGLTAIAIGAERGWVTYEQAYERVLGTLNTLLNNVPQENGFFYHFLDMETAKRAWNSEVSIIDTAIALCGALTAGEYFGGEVKQKAEQLYKRVNWPWFVDNKVKQFYMAYSPEKGFQGHWDFYAEQFMLYFLAAGSPTFPADPNLFYSFQRHYGSYGGGKRFIHSWFGSIFTYQFSFAWFDLRNMIDKSGVDWWENSVIAITSNRKYCIDNKGKFKTFGENSWGLTACDGPKGYEGRYGTPPSGYNNDQHYVDGTVPPAGAAGSIVFLPDESIAALEYYYKNYPQLWGKYGFKDAYNIDVKPAWYAQDVIGIDKGITLLMIENYRNEFVWKYFMKNAYVQSGIEKVGLKKKN